MFVVVENTPGYLPEDDDPATFETFEEAERHAMELVGEIVERAYDEGAETVIPRLVHVEREHGTLWRVVWNEPHRLDRVVEIIEDDEGEYDHSRAKEDARNLFEEDDPDDSADVWTLLDEAPAGCGGIADLYHWSTNYDAGKGPFTLFMDLLGWSDDELGEPVFAGSLSSFGYVELDKLGLALREYAEAPGAVREYVEALMRAELSS